MYSMSESNASFSVGLIVIPGAAGGIFLGGALALRFPLIGLLPAFQHRRRLG